MTNFVKKYPAVSLFILALIFGLAPTLPAVAGLIPPAYMQLAALSASAAGITLAAIEGRKGGVRELLRRALIWRVDPGWWLFVFLFPIAMTFATLYIAKLFGGPEVDLSALPPISSLVPTIIMLIIFAGLGEEFGWRGFAIPRLQNRYNALVSGLIIGCMHWLWHTPLFIIPGTGQYGMGQEFGVLVAFLGYGSMVISWAILLSWIFNNTGGSVLMVAVYHGVLNAWTGYTGAMEHPIRAYTYIALSILVSIVIVVLFGAENLSRKNKKIMLQETQLSEP